MSWRDERSVYVKLPYIHNNTVKQILYTNNVNSEYKYAIIVLKLL